MIIDVHAHCIPESFRAWMESEGGPLGLDLVPTERGTAVRIDDRVTTQPLRDDLTDHDRRLAELDRMGLDHQVLSGWIDLTAYELEPDAGSRYARIQNECLAEEAAKAPDRFSAIGTVPLQDVTAAVNELDHAIRGFGMKGVELATTVDGRFIDEAGLDDFWAAAQDLGAFIVLHPMRPLEGIDLGRYFMENMIARPAETTIALAGLIFSGVFERFPRLKVCVVHGGGFAPFQIGRMDAGYHQKPTLAGKHISKPPSDYLNQIYVDTVLHHPAALRYVVELMGADRVMLGTDYPFEMGSLDPVDFVRSGGFDDDTTEAILGSTAEALIGL
ncbi:MAG: amidohydrolase family protein [Acidimicrobiia bacterium]|nr:amidohydrolase family protein [Acidimicrobiia bacterium]